jgi:hypothetical protein
MIWYNQSYRFEKIFPTDSSSSILVLHYVIESMISSFAFLRLMNDENVIALRRKQILFIDNKLFRDNKQSEQHSMLLNIHLITTLYVYIVHSPWMNGNMHMYVLRKGLKDRDQLQFSLSLCYWNRKSRTMHFGVTDNVTFVPEI